MSDIFELGYKVDTSNLKKANSELKNLTQETGRATHASKKSEVAMGSVTKALGYMAAGYAAIATASFALKEADKFNILQQRIKTATKATGDYASVSKELFAISQKTGTALESNVILFQSLARVAPELKATNTEMLSLTKTLQQLGTIGGSTGEQMGNAMLQFGQAMAGGILRAEEFNSIVENTPEIASRIAHGMELTVGQLRMAVLEGKVLADDVFQSLKEQAIDINREFEKMPPTLEKAGEMLGNSMDRFLGAADQSLSITQQIALGMQGWSMWIDQASTGMREDLKLTLQIRDLRKEINEGASLFGNSYTTILAKQKELKELESKRLDIWKETDKSKAESAKTAGEEKELAGLKLIDSKLDEMLDKAVAEDKWNQKRSEETHSYRMELLKKEAEARDSIVAKRDYMDIMLDAASNSFSVLKDRDTILKQLTETQKMLNDQVADFVNITDEEASGLNDLMSRAKIMAEGVDDYGDAWTRTGNKAIDALGSMSAVMAKTHGTDKKYADIMADLRKEGQQDTKEYIKLEKLRAKNSVHGSIEMMGASVAMYEEGSDAQKAAHAAYLVMQAVELAGNLQLAISNATVAVANQGKGDPYTAFARIAAMGVMMGGVLSQIGASFGTSGGASASYEAVAQSGSGVLGGGDTQSITNLSERLMDVNADQYSELREINKNTRFLNKATTASAGALYATGDISRLSKDLSIFKKSGIVDFADSIGDMLNNPLFGTFGDIGGIGSTILGAIFGGGTKRTSVGYGLDVGGTQGNVGVSGYQKIKKRTDGGWFGKSKTSYYDIASQVDPRVQEALASTYAYLGSTLSDLGKVLDRDVTSVIGGLKVTTGKIELSGLSGEAVQKKLSEAISIQADTWAYSLFGGLIQTYQKMEESAFDTLSRLAIDKAVVEDVLSSTGKTVTGDAIALSQALIEIAGSLEGLTDSAKTYYDAFFTDAEKFADLTEKLSGALGSVNLELPATRQGYRALVESLDLTTQSGKEAYVTLLNLSDSADKYYKDIGDLQTKSFDELGKALENTFDSLIGSVSTSQMKYMTAQSSLSNILELARGGVMPTAQGIQGTLTALQGNNQSSYATYEDFARDQRITAGMVNELIGYTNGTMTIEDQMLNELQAQTAIMSGNINSAPVAYGGQSSQTSELITEVRAMKADIREFKQQSRDVGIQLIAQATDTTDVLEKFDIIGMPGVRV